MTEPVNIQPQRLKKLLRRMIDIYSPSGKEEELLDYLHGFLKRHGLPVQKQEVDENRHNLVVAPEGAEIQLALVGHLDTVTAYDLDDYGYEEEGDQVLGLGAADMKGGCAAMVEAYLSLGESDRHAPVALALVVGEEEEGDGADRLVREMDFPWAIIGEPTDLAPAFANYGYIELQMSTKGARSHASLAKSQKNPIIIMLKLITHLTQHLDTRRNELAYNIRDLYSSQAGFIVPELCEAWIDIHLPPAAPFGEIMQEIEEILAREAARHSGIETIVRFVTVDAGYQLPEKGPMFESLKTIYKNRSLEWNPRPFRSHSDANRLWSAGVRPILLGPGRLEVAHTPDEAVSFEQVQLAASLYLDIVRSIVA